MKINRDTILIKAHYFLFFAGMAPILPFVIVLGVSLGVPIALMGFVSSLVLITTVFAKPMLSLVADSFPACRKIIFVGAILSCGMAIGSVCFIPTVGRKPHFPASWLITKAKLELFEYRNYSESYGALLEESLDVEVDTNETVFTNQSSWSNEEIKDNVWEQTKNKWSDMRLILRKQDSCVMQRGFDCSISATEQHQDFVQLNLLESEDGIEIPKGFLSYSALIEKEDGSLPVGEVSVTCVLGKWSGSCPEPVWSTRGFWGFFSLLLVGLIAFSTANSFSDAVTVEIIGPTGNYGSQRAWGSAGWGLMGPVSGLLVDWWSGPAEVKDYTPAFLIVFFVMAVDTVLAANLKVPSLEVNSQVWESVWPLVRQPRFFLFLFFSVLNGCFDGVVLNFLFVLQEDMAKGSGAMQNIKFIQGMTIFVQCATEVPCMFLSDHLVKKIGADRVTTMVLGLHVLRLLLILWVGLRGSVWHTLFVELLNGPCYGFGYSAIVVYAGQLAPPGASTTVQSLANICYESIGYAVSSLLSGLMVAKIGTVKLFFVWAMVGVVTCAFHMVYVRCVPPIQDSLTYPGLKKHPQCAGLGTVEEELCLKADDLEGHEHRQSHDSHHREGNNCQHKRGTLLDLARVDGSDTDALLVATQHGIVLESDMTVMESDTIVGKNDTSNLENDTSFLENDTSFLENDTSFLENDTSILENDTTVLENDTTGHQQPPNNDTNNEVEDDSPTVGKLLMNGNVTENNKYYVENTTKKPVKHNDYERKCNKNVKTDRSISYCYVSNL